MRSLDAVDLVLAMIVWYGAFAFEHRRRLRFARRAALGAASRDPE